MMMNVKPFNPYEFRITCNLCKQCRVCKLGRFSWLKWNGWFYEVERKLGNCVSFLYFIIRSYMMRFVTEVLNLVTEAADAIDMSMWTKSSSSFCFYGLQVRLVEIYSTLLFVVNVFILCYKSNDYNGLVSVKTKLV